MTIVEPKEASMGKPANDEFDAKAFLAKVGAGKTILEFHKNQNVFEQGDIADTVFCDPQSDRVYDTTGAVAVRRVKVA